MIFPRSWSARDACQVVGCRRWATLTTLLATILIIGCAKQYHWYDCGCDCVNYRYCQPSPLPYAPYCGCPTPVAQSYDCQLRQQLPDEQAPDAESD